MIDLNTRDDLSCGGRQGGSAKGKRTRVCFARSIVLPGTQSALEDALCNECASGVALHLRRCLISLMSALVEASCDVTAPGAQLGQDGVGQFLAKLDAPLVERVDVPDDPLHEDLVLVERDEACRACAGPASGRAASSSGRLPGNILCGSSVARASPITPAASSSARASARVLPFISASVWARKLASSKRVVLADGVVRLDGSQKVAGHQLRALMDKLIEGVLTVGAGLAPDHGTGLIVGDDARRGSRPCRSIPCRPHLRL